MSFAQYRWKLSTILFTAFLFSTPLSAAQTLIYSDHEPLGNMRTRFINDVFFAAIEKESHGRINIEAHWDSELSSGYDALAMVGEGKKADLAVVVPEYASTALPLHQLFKRVQSAWVKGQEAKGVVDMKETLEKLVEIKHSFD